MSKGQTDFGIIVLFAILVCAIFVWVWRPARADDQSGMNRYRPGVVCVRLSPAAVSIPSFRLRNGTRSDSITGLGALDSILQSKGLQSFKTYAYVPANQSAAHNLGLDRDFLIFVDDSVDCRALASQLVSMDLVNDAHPDWYGTFHLTPNDTFFNANWGHVNTGQFQPDTISTTWSCNYGENSFKGKVVGTNGFDTSVDAAWGTLGGYGDSNIVIAIIDNGMDLTHPDLRIVSGWDYGEGGEEGDSDPSHVIFGDTAVFSHGTWCAGIAAGIADNGIGVAGVAGGCSVMPLKISNSQDLPVYSAAVKAILRAADSADVISASWTFDIDDLENDSAMISSVNYAVDTMLVPFFAATGNLDWNYVNLGFIPALYDNVIAVGWASPCGERKRKGSSGLGVSCDGYKCRGSNFGAGLDFCAPSILPTTDYQDSLGANTSTGTAGDYWMHFGGTSCATPYAAGIAALLLSKDPMLTAGQIRKLMQDACTDMTAGYASPGYDMYTGFGLVNAQKSFLYTIHSDTIFKDEEWYKGPIIVDGDITVLDTVTLTIAEGVTVLVSDHDRLLSGSDTNNIEFIIEGTLRVEGTSGNRVRIECLDLGWYGIVVEPGGSAVIRYADILNAYAGVYDKGSADDTIANCHFTRNEVYGIKTKNSNLVVTGCLVDTMSTGYGIYVDACEPTIVDNTVIECEYGVYLNASKATIEGCVIRGIGANGIRVWDAAGAGASNAAHLNDILVAWLFEAHMYFGAANVSVNDCWLSSSTAGSYRSDYGIVTWFVEELDLRDTKITGYDNAGVYGGISYTNGWDFGHDDTTGGHWWGYNSIHTDDTTSYAIEGTFGQYITAERNWWGTSSPDSSLFNPPKPEYYVDFEPYLTSSPKTSAPATEEVNTLPGSFALHPNYPNPFNPATMIQFDLPVNSNVELAIYNILGQKVITLLDDKYSAGSYEVQWNGVNAGGERVSSGVYFYRLTAGSFTQARKMMLIK